MRKIGLLIVLVLAFTLLMANFASAEEIAEIAGGEETCHAGDTVGVDVSITSNPGISAYLLEVGYDDTNLTLESVDFNSEFAVDGYQIINGNLIMWANEKENDLGDLRPYDTTFTGLMFTINFKVSETAPAGDYDVVLKISETSYGTVEGNVSNAAAEHVDASFTDGVIHVVEEVTETGAELFTEPTNKEYYVGDTFTADGGVIRVYCSDGTHEDVPVTNDMCSEYDMTTAGEQTVKVTYEGYEFEYDITVSTVTLIRAELFTEPTKKEYYVGDTFTADGGVIRVFYSNGTHEDVPVTNDMCSGYDMTTAGEQTVLITYRDYEFEYDIMVSEVTIVGSELIDPDKIEYDVGETFTANGGRIRIYYSNGTYEDIPVTNDMCYDYNTSVEGTQTVTVKLGDFEFTYEITVGDVENEDTGDISDYSYIVWCVVALCVAASVYVLKKKSYNK